MRWRSSDEIAFRVRQELRNLALLAKPPVLVGKVPRKIAFLPDPESVAAVVRGSRTEDEIVRWAKQILDRRFPILGLEIETGPEVRWRRDYQLGKETGTPYFRRIPYLNAPRVGDHKIIWELNRHQHLVLLAQAYRLTGATKFVRETVTQLESWFEANPFHRGINWASALEVAFRALSWIWVLHLAGDGFEPAFRARFETELYRHGAHLANNLSHFFSPNTHLLGEAVALHALGLLFREAAGAENWERAGTRVVWEQMERQVRADGSHFEQSSYYHLYALDMFLFHAALAPVPDEYGGAILRMAEYLDALMGPSGSLPFLGDDDGGRFFHPYGERKRFGRATLATCGAMFGRSDWIRDREDLCQQAVWWLGALRVDQPVRKRHWASRRFEEAGTVVMASERVSCIVRAGPFGAFRAGHSHADALSMVVAGEAGEVVVDPGTFTYVGEERGAFRGTAAHNTVRVEEQDQAQMNGPFAWRNPPEVRIRQWIPGAEADYLDAECRYRRWRHRRRVFFIKPALLFVLDDVECESGGAGRWLAEQFWHAGAGVEIFGTQCWRIGSSATLVLDRAAGAVEWREGGAIGWRSRVFGAKEKAPVIVNRREGTKSLRFGAALILSAERGACELTVRPVGDRVQMTLTANETRRILVPEAGLPERVGVADPENVAVLPAH